MARTEGRFACYVHHLDSGAGATIDADEHFPAASLIKIPIMLRLLEQAQLGEISLADSVRLTDWHKTGGAGIVQFFQDGQALTLMDACTAMIALSDNTATNMLLDVTGIAPVNTLLDQLGCPGTRLHRYLGKPEMPGPPGPSQVVPEEMGRLLERLVRRASLTPEYCDLALTMLRRQTHRALIPRYLPEGTDVAHKTGSLNGVRHDAGIIWLPEAPLAHAPDRNAHAGHPRADPMARPTGGSPTGSPLVFVGMSKEVADLRWTVENEAEVAIARAARAAYDYFVSARCPE